MALDFLLHILSFIVIWHVVPPSSIGFTIIINLRLFYFVAHLALVISSLSKTLCPQVLLDIHIACQINLVGF